MEAALSFLFIAGAPDVALVRHFVVGHREMFGPDTVVIDLGQDYDDAAQAEAVMSAMRKSLDRVNIIGVLAPLAGSGS